MSHPYTHAEESVKRYGGKPEDYMAIHHWFDATKAYMSDWRHRSMRHHAEGIGECLQEFGVSLQNSEGRTISVEQIAEDHILEDLGFIPKATDWFERFDETRWTEFKKQKQRERRLIQKKSDRVPSTAQQFITQQKERAR